MVGNVYDDLVSTKGIVAVVKCQTEPAYNPINCLFFLVKGNSSKLCDLTKRA